MISISNAPITTAPLSVRAREEGWKVVDAGPGGEPAAAPPAAPALVPASFADMYRGAVAAAVDADGDGQVSPDEYARQLGIADGDGASLRWKALDRDGDGKVGTAEFAATLDNPLDSERDALLRRIVTELARGGSAAEPRGDVLDAAGKVADPHAVLRYLAANFSGNMRY